MNIQSTLIFVKIFFEPKHLCSPEDREKWGEEKEA